MGWSAPRGYLPEADSMSVCPYIEKRLVQGEPSAATLNRSVWPLALAAKRLSHQEDLIAEAYINDMMPLNRYKLEMEKVRHSNKSLSGPSMSLSNRPRASGTPRKLMLGPLNSVQRLAKASSCWPSMNANNSCDSLWSRSGSTIIAL